MYKFYSNGKALVSSTSAPGYVNVPANATV